MTITDTYDRISRGSRCNKCRVMSSRTESKAAGGTTVASRGNSFPSLVAPRAVVRKSGLECRWNFFKVQGCFKAGVPATCQNHYSVKYLGRSVYPGIYYMVVL